MRNRDRTARRNRPPDVALLAARKYFKSAKAIGLFFALGVVVLVPFLDNSPLNRYWRPFGQAIVLTVGALWLALIFTAAMALIHWLAHRELQD
jgi:ABC-type Mn2+/Zn2+ transport system permease subunit